MVQPRFPHAVVRGKGNDWTTAATTAAAAAPTAAAAAASPTAAAAAAPTAAPTAAAAAAAATAAAAVCSQEPQASNLSLYFLFLSTSNGGKQTVIFKGSHRPPQIAGWTHVRILFCLTQDEGRQPNKQQPI